MRAGWTPHLGVTLMAVVALSLGCAGPYRAVPGQYSLHPWASLEEAKLASKDLSGVSLKGADLTSAYLSGATLSDTVLRQASLYTAELTRAKLAGADMLDANLYGAELAGADLDGANLRRSNLQFANLRDAALTSADLREALLIGADLGDADLRGAIYNYETSFPVEFEPHDAGMAYWQIDERILDTHRVRRRANGLRGGYWRYWRH